MSRWIVDLVWFLSLRARWLLKTQEACLWGLVKPYQVHAPAEMLEVGGRGDAVGIVSCIGCTHIISCL
ncbi:MULTISPECIES: hypothetical protein [unclassified Bartonella]|uniref:hypothetical protein n=1 Tax=unclassified Bartonella TaxID=2645622 RepID=UPI0035D05107